MKKISIKLSCYLINKEIIDKNSFSLYQYGIQNLLEVLLSTIMSIIIALCFNLMIESILFFLVFIPLRSYAGGYHCDKYINCLLCSCLTLGGILFIVKNIILPINYSVVLFIISLYGIKKQGIIMDVNRTLDNQEVKYFSKKLRLTLSIFTLIEITFSVLKFEKIVFLISIVFFFMLIVLLAGKIKYQKRIYSVNKEALSNN